MCARGAPQAWSAGPSTSPLERMDRPHSVRTLALILTLLGISAVGGMLGFPLREGIYIAPSLQRVDPAVAKWLIFSAGVFYCASTLLAAYSLWTLRSWAPRAYVGFGLSLFAFCAVTGFILPVPTDIFVALLFFGVLMAALLKGWRVIKNAKGSFHAL